MKISAVSVSDVPPADATYSTAILAEADKLLIISGQVPRDMQAGPETQIRQVLEAIEKILAQAGGSFKNVVMLRSYFVDMGRDLPIFRKVRREFLAEPFPASTAVGVTELALANQQVEIEAVAVF